MTLAPIAMIDAPISVRMRPRSSRIRDAMGTPCAASAADSASAKASFVASGPRQPPPDPSHDAASTPTAHAAATIAIACSRIVPARRAIGAASIVIPTSSR